MSILDFSVCPAAQLKTINLAARNEKLLYFSLFSAYLLVCVCMKSKPVREQLFIKEKRKKKKKTAFHLYGTFGSSVTFSNPFI